MDELIRVEIVLLLIFIYDIFFITCQQPIMNSESLFFSLTVFSGFRVFFVEKMEDSEFKLLTCDVPITSKSLKLRNV